MRRAHCMTFYASSFLLPFAWALRQPREEYVGMQTFLTRPDIECASWKVTVYDEDAIAPGYWFVSPYEKNGYKLPGGSWIGPHIYDKDGELVWSGSYLVNNINTMDFGVMNVGGEALLSMSYAVNFTGVLLDHQYQVKQTVVMGTGEVNYNMHDFRTVENGDRFLYLQRNITHASADIARQDLGYDGECSVTFPGFEERDVGTGEVVFKWDATGKIPLSDSTMAFEPVERICTGGTWDYLHSNSIDKFSDGHYLLSTRHSDTIYKISKDDGSIIWRLHGHGGERSDFEMINLNFSRQHHARIREQNETHTVISLLDNAVGADPQPATTPWSRGLVVTLREDTMTAELVASYDHPHRGHAFRRGNAQMLPSGNVFMGWSEQALQSEHTPDGRLIMEAELVERKLGTYRAFKFPFVGNPKDPPDIYSNASSFGNETTTSIYASWNGATEVASWTLYKTTKNGDRTLQLASVPRSGFETRINHEGYARYVFVQANDKSGKTLGESTVIEPTLSKDISSIAIAEELLWLQSGSDSRNQAAGISGNPIFLFVAGLTCGVIMVVSTFYAARRQRRWFSFRRNRVYERVIARNSMEYDATTLDDLSPSKSYSDDLDKDVFKLSEVDTDEDKPT